MAIAVDLGAVILWFLFVVISWLWVCGFLGLRVVVCCYDCGWLACVFVVVL